MSKYIPSVNIETGISKDFQYVVTPNVQVVLGQLINTFHSGSHSFTIIGTYGTGKSSFLMALERDLSGVSRDLIQSRDIFEKGISNYEFLNILGDYASLSSLIGKKLACDANATNGDVMDAVKLYYKQLAKKGKFLTIVVDEFGKVLEHAAKVDPNNELYFLQQLAEFCNANKQAMLLTTLHQNFGAYAQKLNNAERQEWNKVKGRFNDVVFAEPIEQLLYMASKKLEDQRKPILNEPDFISLLKLAKSAKFVSDNLSVEITKSLYPLDPFSANCLTQAIQRYGQNERTLFSFLAAQGQGSLQSFEPTATETYNLAHVFDYIVYAFYSALSEVNADSMSWSAMRESIDRVESGVIAEELIDDARKLVKAIGLMNLFGGSGVSISKEMLMSYGSTAMSIADPETVLEKLEGAKIIRYASYKKQYILFEGTDIDIENSLLIAGSKVAQPNADVQELGEYIEAKVSSAVAEYYKKGTPRYFEYVPENEPTVIVPKDDVDGTIQLVFPLPGMTLETVKEISASNQNANLYVYFNNIDTIVKHLHQIKKLQYLLDFVVLEDRVAKREVSTLLDYEKHLLNESINASIIAGDNNVTWIYKGQELHVDSQGSLKKLLSKVCEEVYYKTPELRNELFNRQKLSSAISLARVNLLDALLEHGEDFDLGFDAKAFPPEKTIYYTLLKNTGIHRPSESDASEYVFGEPEKNIISLWEASEAFLRSSIEKPKKVGELIKILKTAPFKLKQGVIDFWIPVFLFIKQQDYALYNGEDVFVMKITKEVFELLQKQPQNFSVKAFEIEGVKMEYFHQYRKLLRDTSPEDALNSSTFIQTIKPFLGFYKSLNEYAKSTRKFDNSETSKFRDVLARAKDPEKTFFVDLPEALGLKTEDLQAGDTLTARVKMVMNELRNCYDELIQRIESNVVSALDLSNDYNIYKEEIENRYAYVKEGLLTQKSKVFLERILAPSATKKEFWEKVCNAVLDKRLEQLKDKEEEKMVDEILFLFRELDRYVDISQLDDFMTNDEAYSFEMASTKGASHKQQTFRLSSGQVAQANEIEKQIISQLSGDENLDVCVLLRLLNEKLGKK